MGQITRETVERITDANDIVEVVSAYFPLKRSGARWVALCPFHTEKSPSFGVNPQRQIYHCFGCGAGGDVIRFVMQYENLPFPEAAKKLADRAGIPIQEEAFDAKEEAGRRFRRELQTLQRKAAEWYHRQLLRAAEAEPARAYLKGRGFGIETAKRWLFGYAPESPAPLVEWAAKEGYTQRHLVEGGLAQWREEGRPQRGVYARFRRRLMFPVANDFGDVIAFSGRVLSPDQPGGKYVNSPETPLFNKSKTFFGLDKSKRAILRESRAVVVEGQIDLISAFEAGIENIVAPLGTAFTEQHARLLKRHTEEVVLCYDSDSAGYNAAVKAFRVLAAAGLLVRVAQLPPGEDPDSLIRKQGAEALAALLADAPEFFDFQIDRHGGGRDLDSLRDRLAFARELSENIALIEDKMLQDSLISRVTTRLGVGESDVRKLVAEARSAAMRAARSQQRREAAASQRESGGNSAAGSRAPGTASPAPSPASEASPSAPGAESGLSFSNRSVRLLCQLLLSDAEARKAVTAAPPPDFLRDIPETELLAKIWQADFNPGSNASVAGFTAGLSPREQAAVARLRGEDLPPAAPDFAKECLHALRRQSLQIQIRGIKARLKDSRIDAASQEALTKELLDLTKRLHDTSAPSGDEI